MTRQKVSIQLGVFFVLRLTSHYALAGEHARQESPAVVDQSTGVGADDSAAGAPDRPYQIALVVSGGVSLGAYQAGWLYYASEVLKHNPDQLKLRVVTGASAGTINAMLTVLETCRKSQANPRESLFWKAWMDVGFDQLFLPDEVTATSAFSRQALKDAADRIEHAWNQGGQVSCDTVFGVSTTRLDRYPVWFGGTSENPKLTGVKVHRMEEKFVLRISAEENQPYTVLNYVNKSHPLPQPLLPVPAPENALQGDFDHIRRLLFASSGFPIAFSPQSVLYCMSRDDDSDCTEPTEVGDFIDGGVFDNNPLRLAHRIVNGGLVSCEQEDDPSCSGGLRWREQPTLRGDGNSNKSLGAVRYVYLDPDNTAFPQLAGDPRKNPQERLLGALMRFAENFVTTARSKELYALFEDYPAIEKQLQNTTRYYPTASGHLANFFGFFDKEFRQFDFYLGMYDAHRYLKSFLARADIEYPEDRPGLATSPGVADSWNPFLCMLGVLDRTHPLAAKCEAEGLRDFSILLQTSLERLYSHCRRIRPELLDEPFNHYDCLLGRAGEAPPVVPGVRPLENDTWASENGESEFAHLLRLLGAHEMDLEDLELGPDDADAAATEVSKRLQDVVKGVAAEQSAGENLLLNTAGRYGLASALEPIPPLITLYAGLNFDRGVEGGFALRVWPAWTRAQIGLRVFQFGPILLDAEEDIISERMVTANPYLRYVATLPFSGPTLQFEAGAGYNARTRWSKNGVVYYRHGVEASVGAVLLQRLYLDLFFNHYFDDCRNENTCPEILGEYRDYNLPLVKQNWYLGANLGWRWIW